MLYRITNFLNYSWFSFRTAGIQSTPPLACDPQAACEVHTMLSARDMPLYLPAIKSFLRFYPRVAVVVHSDGTLTAAHEETVRRHIPGVKLIQPKEADERARQTLGADSFLFQLRSVDAAYRRLIDTELWNDKPKRIILDSDVLVLRRPDEVINWIENGQTPFLIGQEPTPPPPGDGPKPVQILFKEKLPQLGAALGCATTFLDGGTGGFYGCPNQPMLQRCESIVKAATDLGVPMKRWGSDQCVIIYVLSLAGAVRLSPERHINFDPSCVPQLDRVDVVHFYGTYRFYRHLYTQLAVDLIASLR